MNINGILPYVINLLLGIIGFFVVASYNSVNETIAAMNKDVLRMNTDVMSMRIELTELSDRMMTDERVKELIRLELMKGK